MPLIFGLLWLKQLSCFSVSFSLLYSTTAQCDKKHKKCIIWSSSQPFCPSYPSSTSVPLGEWDWLPCEGPHQFVGFHPPTTLTWGSSLSRSPLNNTLLPQKLIFVQQLHHTWSKKQALVFHPQSSNVVEQHRRQKAHLKPLDKIKMYQMFHIDMHRFQNFRSTQAERSET